MLMVNIGMHVLAPLAQMNCCKWNRVLFFCAFCFYGEICAFYLIVRFIIMSWFLSKFSFIGIVIN